MNTNRVYRVEFSLTIDVEAEDADEAIEVARQYASIDDATAYCEGISCGP